MINVNKIAEMLGISPKKVESMSPAEINKAVVDLGLPPDPDLGLDTAKVSGPTRGDGNNIQELHDEFLGNTNGWPPEMPECVLQEDIESLTSQMLEFAEFIEFQPHADLSQIFTTPSGRSYDVEFLIDGVWTNHGQGSNHVTGAYVHRHWGKNINVGDSSSNKISR